jgi:hypothetical protein
MKPNLMINKMKIKSDMIMTERENAVFDLIISDLGSPANNPESDYWTFYTVVSGQAMFPMMLHMGRKLSRC